MGNSKDFHEGISCNEFNKYSWQCHYNIYTKNECVRRSAFNFAVTYPCSLCYMFPIVCTSGSSLHFNKDIKLSFDYSMVKILNIGVQMDWKTEYSDRKIACSFPLVATFGAVSISANAVAGTVCSFGCIPGNAIGLYNDTGCRPVHRSWKARRGTTMQ